jgi:hypothetical protein
MQKKQLSSAKHLMHRILQTGFCVAGALHAWLDSAKLTQNKKHILHVLSF